MRIYSTSRGLDPTALSPGDDLVLDIDEAHGLELPNGVMALDHLDVDDRWELDRTCTAELARWRETYDQRLTVDGICLPWVWELHIMIHILGPTVRHAVALQRALEEYRPRSVTLMDRDDHAESIVLAAAKRLGASVNKASPPRVATDHESLRRPKARARRVRRMVLGVVSRLGFPSLLRRGSVLIYPYWQLMPLLDRMLDGKRWQPAVYLHKRPSGTVRSLRAALRGGWVGLPGARARRAAGRRTAAAVEAIAAAPELDISGLSLGSYVHGRILELLRHKACIDVALAATLRRAFGTGRVQRLIVPFDRYGDARLMVFLAEEAGVASLLVSHGAVLLPRTLPDMDVSDEVALWSEAGAPPEFARRGRPVHVVGYPVAHQPPSTRLYHGSPTPRIVVLGQPKDLFTSLVDARITMTQYAAALNAVTTRFPRATIILRPHPQCDLHATQWIMDRFRSFDVRLDATTEIVELLESSDLCIGGTSTAMMQAALVGTPVVVLNLTGVEWRWPLGGNTTVPVARSTEELAAHLERWAGSGTLPGREALLTALGADGGDGVARILDVLASPRQGSAPGKRDARPTDSPRGTAA